MFNIHQSVYNKHGEHDERLVGKYIDGLMKEFARSPEAQPIIEQYGDVGYAGMMLEYYFNYIGGQFPSMTVPDFNEVVFELFPRKVSTPPESAPAVIAELKAFWSFVRRQYSLENAEAILAALNDEAVTDLRDDLADPSKYGMAKSFVMGGLQSGYDMHTQEGVDAYMREYNARLLGGQLPLPALPDDFEDYEGDEEDGGPPVSRPAPPAKEQREKKRKDRKRQRQARKRGRK